MIYTAEAVTRAHPDKVCDQISDSVLDRCLAEDPFARVAVETLGGHGEVVIMGEVTTKAQLTEEECIEIARRVYRENGYTDEIAVRVVLSQQSPEIGAGVDNNGAGDQGVMVGYATDETPSMMPLELYLARLLVTAMGLHDGKAQVTVEHGAVTNVVTSLCESGDMADVSLDAVFAADIEPLFKDTKPVWLKNPNGAWTVGGFAADTGLTGRKIVIDAYGPRVQVGGGAFSGKDATKVDRSGAYMARKIAVDYVLKGAHEATVTLAYAIGHPEPLAAIAVVDGKEEVVRGYDLRPRAIIEQLGLRKPTFYQTAQNGHFGHDFPWDR